MNRLLLILIVVCVAEVYGHAVLVSPKPWWWEPSRLRPCGGPNYTSSVSAVWPTGSNQSKILWNVVAGDGMGEVHARIDTNGRTDNFSNGYPIGFKQQVFKTLGQYYISFIVPPITCTGPNDTCTMQFWTDSGGGWYSCITFKINCTNCEGGIPVSRDDCVSAGNLGFCKSKSNTQVFVPDGETATEIDGLTQNTFNQNHPNPNVFSNGNSTECMTLYQEMLCELYLAPCGNFSSSYTQQMCQKTMNTCNLTVAHQYLYNCSVFPTAQSGPNGAMQHTLPWLCIVFLLISVLLL